MIVVSNLSSGLEAMALALPAAAMAQFDNYLDLLEKWNGVINLTAVRERERMITLHLLDSLTVIPQVENAASLLDVGSGAGLPGIPLAIAMPSLKVTLMEPNQKKAAFLRQAKLELGLENITVVAQRVEQHSSENRYDVIVSRAFSDLPDFVSAARHLLAPGGRMIAMKGVTPFEEIARLPNNLKVHIVPVSVPQMTAERHLIILEEKTP
jgi:16S rRNA (guanine527-N7)-methyltransferase